MVSKESYNYDAKNAARDELREFISQSYNDNNRKDLSVLTLGGHETTELEQVWDPLGVPRENITSVENSKDAYRKILQNNPGINLVYNDLSDFLRETDQKFDIINLDYDGPHDFNKFGHLKEIAYGELLEKNPGILATWYAGRRESKEQQRVMQSRIKNLYNTFISSMMEKYQDSNEIQKQDLESLTEIQHNLDKGDVRSDFFGEEIISNFMFPPLNFEQHPLIEKLGIQEEYEKFLINSDPYKERTKTFMEAIKRGASLKDIGKDIGYDGYREEVLEAYKRSRKNALKRERPSEEDRKTLMEDLHILGVDKVQEKLEKKVEGLVEKEIPQQIMKEMSESENKLLIKSISTAINIAHLEPYFVTNSKRLKYHSDNGTPMYADFFKMESPDIKGVENFKINQEKRIKSPKNYFINNNPLDMPIDLQKKAKNQFSISLPERKYITARENQGEVQTGRKNSGHEFNMERSSQEQVKNTLSGDDVYKLLQEGKTKDQIREIDPSWSKHQISAKRAWITMKNEGVKGGRPRKHNKQEESKPASEPGINDEKKEFAISLLKEGHSTKEILEAFPEEFSDYQLRGYKAAISRGNL